MTGYIVDIEKLPPAFPTHRHAGAFWEALGRAVATFGFLEETLTKAVFAYTGTRLCSEEEAESAYDVWLQLLERSLSDQLGGLINKYDTAVRNHHDSQIENLDQLLSDLRQASAVRNVLCHGSWHPPDENGKSRHSL